MSRTINPNIYPKDGYYFQDSDGSRHFGDTWNGVIWRVKRYRQRQGKPADNVAQEVMDQACQRAPSICVEVNEASKHQLVRASLKGRILTWLNALRARKEKQPLAFQDDGAYGRRATICARCPHNTQLPEGCASCRAALKELRENIIGKRFVDGRLNSCAVLGEFLPVSAWLDEQAVAEPALPGHCWRKRSL